MAERYTVKDVREAMRRLVDVAERTGVKAKTDGPWVLQQGSPTNGQAWRLFGTEVGNTGRHNLSFTGSNGYIGWTAKEATETLSNYAAGMWAVWHVMGGDA